MFGKNFLPDLLEWEREICANTFKTNLKPRPWKKLSKSSTKIVMDTSKPKNWNPWPPPWVRNCPKPSFWSFGPKPMSTMTESWITMNSSKWWRSIERFVLVWNQKVCDIIGSSIVKPSKTIPTQYYYIYEKYTKIEKLTEKSNKIIAIKPTHFFKGLFFGIMPAFLVIFLLDLCTLYFTIKNTRIRA